jgi:abortive infection bacteriophage resistance protein
MAKKVFRSLEEQIEILKSKGLIIEDEIKTKEILFRENYFFISGYRHLFMKSYKDREFIKGTTFDELYAVFLFDRKLRNIMFQYILVVENNIKSIISYQLSKKYGIHEKDYLDPKNFTQDNLKQRQVHDILNKMRRQIHVNGRQHTATTHYLDNYGYIPLWILVKVLSFGILSELYNILKSEDASFIAQIYHLDIEELSDYLAILANFRNLCAHEDILYEHRTQKEIWDTRYHKILNISMTEGHYDYGKNDLFAVMIIMKQMLTKEEFKDFFFQIGYEIDILDGKVDTVKTPIILNNIGFPTNWRELDDIY